MSKFRFVLYLRIIELKLYVMSKSEKLIERFKNMPTDFTFDEMVKLLSIFGYEMETKGKTSGSRVEFHHDEYQAIMFHKPHPSGPFSAPLQKGWRRQKKVHPHR